jgi:hypothetical protein
MSNNQKLYRFFSLPGDTLERLKFENIKLDDRTTIDDILLERIKLQQKINEIIFPKPNEEEQKIINDSLLPHKLPEPYFSLYKINYLIHEEILWLSKLESLNDISESNKWMTPTFLKFLKEEQGKRFITEEEALINEEAKNFDGFLRCHPFPNREDSSKNAEYYGVVSFCLDEHEPDSSIMWGHYANGHYGVCIGFEMHRLLKASISQRNILLGYYSDSEGAIGSIHAWQTMNYDNCPEIWDVGVLEHYGKELKEIVNKNPNYPLTATELAIVKLISTKAKCWEQEQEVRLFLTGVSNNHGISLNKFICPEDRKPYLAPSDFYFGFRVEPQIQALICNSAKMSMNYWQASLKGGTFDIKFSRIN